MSWWWHRSDWSSHRNHPERLEPQGVTGTNQYQQMAAFQTSHNQTDLQREALPGLTNETGSNSLPWTLFHQNQWTCETSDSFWFLSSYSYLFHIFLCVQSLWPWRCSERLFSSHSENSYHNFSLHISGKKHSAQKHLNHMNEAWNVLNKLKPYYSLFHHMLTIYNVIVIIL